MTYLETFPNCHLTAYSRSFVPTSRASFSSRPYRLNVGPGTFTELGDLHV